MNNCFCCFFVPVGLELCLLLQLIFSIDLNWGKWKLAILFCLNGYISIFLTEMIIEKSSMFHKTLVQITKFDWLPGRQKGEILGKCLKIVFSEPIWWMKLILWLYLYMTVAST